MNTVRRKVTMVFQSGALFDLLSVGENVAFPTGAPRPGRGGSSASSGGLLTMVGLQGLADVFPSDLSTGMKRSVAIARALAAQPDAILYDEPTTMVDPLMAQRLGDLIQKLKYQLKLTSIVTHDMRFARKLADTVLFLHQAKAHFFGQCSRWKPARTPSSSSFLSWMGSPSRSNAKQRKGKYPLRTSASDTDGVF